MKFQIVPAVLLVALTVFATAEPDFDVKLRSVISDEDKANIIDFIKLSPEEKSLEDAETVPKIMRVMSLAARKIASRIAQEKEKDKGNQKDEENEGDDKKEDTTEQEGETEAATERKQDEEEDNTGDGNEDENVGEEEAEQGDGKGKDGEKSNEGDVDAENGEEDAPPDALPATDKPLQDDASEEDSVNGANIQAVESVKRAEILESNLHSGRTTDRFRIWFIIDDKDSKRQENIKSFFKKPIMFLVKDGGKAMPVDDFRKKSEELKKEILQAAKNAKLAVEVTVLEKGLPIWVYVAISVGVVSVATCVTVLLVVIARRRRNTDF